ncbi:MAG: zinc-dependent alcohol dehydrogenase family protein [Dehalococcoidia bacterium]|nr:zinc-dependent alcohol dehydrogenase family protein [Dehalococcoidia bacterium]
MHAAMLRRPGPIATGPLTIEEAPPPVPAAGELLLDVVACAACRTDLQLAEGDIAARRVPLIPGHQAVGRVAALGEGVTGWNVGDRAGVAWLASACGNCPYCIEGQENLCPDARFTGWDRDGGFAGQMTVDARFALHLPDGFDDLAVAPLLCGGVIGYRALRVSGIKPGGRLGLFGFGASALLATQVAAHWGCEVFVATRSEPEQERARSLGAVWAGGYETPVPTELDAAVTFAPAGSVVVAALRAIRPGATVAINAIHLDHIPEFSYDLLWRERSLKSVANFTRTDAAEFLSLAAEVPIQTVTETHPLADANRALQRIASGAVQGAAVLVI